MKALPTPGSQINVTIESLDDEGRGRGVVLHAGSEFDVAVRGAFPGDVVMALVERVFASRQLLVCRARDHSTRGPCHIERTCPHTGPCPSCPLHGVDQSLALDLKRARIARALTDAGLDFPIDDVVPHPNEFGYRQKVKLMVGLDEKGTQTLVGTYIPYSHRLRAAYACPYVNPAINDAVAKLVPLVDAQHVKAIIARDTGHGVAAVLVCHAAIPNFEAFTSLVDRGDLLSICERIGDESNSVLSGVINRQHGHSDVDPDAFCQPDPDQAEFMYDLVAEYLTQDNAEGYFIDGYAGVGGFSSALIDHGAEHVIAIEQSASSQAELNELDIEIHATSMRGALTRLGELKSISGLVVDPPAKGLMEEAEPLAKLGAKRVVLVSCDPDAMAKDLAVFLKYDYSVERILPIDLFGGTPAIETLVFLKESS